MRNKSSTGRKPEGTSAKRARGVGAAGQFASKKPVWRFCFVDRSGPFGFQRLTDCEDVKEVLVFLQDLEQKTWMEIEKQTHDRRSKHHFVDYEDMTQDAKGRFREIFPDVESRPEGIFSLGYGNRKRVIGLRKLGIFDILWWDTEHGVSKCSK